MIDPNEARLRAIILSGLDERAFPHLLNFIRTGEITPTAIAEAERAVFGFGMSDTHQQALADYLYFKKFAESPTFQT